jgi:hypothetical protein
MNVKSIGPAVLGGILLVSGCATAPRTEAPQAPAAAPPVAGVLAISTLARYVPDAPVRADVQTKCGLEQKLPQAVKARLGDRAVLADDAPKAAGRALALEIVQVNAYPGGGFTGPKTITVQGTLYDKGERIGGFTARNSDPYGLGVCVQLYRAVDEMAGDIAKWLESPGKDDLLGEVKKP